MVVDLRHGAGCRPQHRAAFLPVGFLPQTRDQAVPEFCCPPKRRRFLPSRHHHDGEIAEGRRVLHPAQLDFQIVKSVVILLRRVPDDLMVGHHRLNNGLSGAVPPAGSAHHLSEHIEGGLPRQIPAGVQAQIGVQHAHQRDVGEVQSLGHHLSPQQNGDAAALELPPYDLLQAIGAEESEYAFFGGYEGDDIPDDLLMRLFQYEELMIKYRSAIREVTTKLHILNDELSAFTKRNPIENIQSRIKRPYSIAKKLSKQGQPVTVESISEHLNDVAGIRVICPFINDIYDVADMLLKQDDILLIARKDYIKAPKENGYRSLHLIVEVPVFFSTGKEQVRVEIQIRTVAMDFWASLEHQIRYKNDSPEVQKIARELRDCADTIAQTDIKMQQLRQRIDSGQ